MAERLSEAGFVCAICRRGVDNRNRPYARDQHLAPLCRRCEEVTHYAWHGGARRRGGIQVGAFRDRRKAYQVAALADALDQEARRGRA